MQPERRDGFGQVMRFGCSDDRGGDDGVAEHPCQRWLLAQQTWIVPIPGTRRRERLAENAAATRVALSADEIADPNTAAARIGVHGNRYNDLHMGLVDR